MFYSIWKGCCFAQAVALPRALASAYCKEARLKRVLLLDNDGHEIVCIFTQNQAAVWWDIEGMHDSAVDTSKLSFGSDIIFETLSYNIFINILECYHDWAANLAKLCYYSSECDTLRRICAHNYSFINRLKLPETDSGKSLRIFVAHAQHVLLYIFGLGFLCHKLISYLRM